MTVRDPVALLLFFLLFPASLSYPHPDLHALLAFRASVDPSGAALSSWDPAVDPCSGAWLGISCSRGHVVRLVLEGLRLAGPVDALAFLSTLSLLSLKNNSFSSPLHRLDFTLWRPHLKLLYLSHNRFSGPFPFGLLQLRHLHRLDLAGNLLSGGIPPEIGLLLPGLLTLRLENNLLTGGIPMSLAAIAELSDLNVSHNNLAGKIPGSLSSFSPSSFAGNLDLCGDPLPRRCLNPSPRSDPIPKLGGGRRRWKWKSKWIWIVAGLVAGAMSTVAAVLLCGRRDRSMKESRGGTGETGGESEKKRSRRKGNGEGREGKMEFFEGCGGEFGLEELMRGSAEMLGRGEVGSTYRVVMESIGGEGVVVKRVRRERRRGKERRAEVAEEGLLREIGGWRDPNVVSLRAYYADDHELLLVYDYLPSGSLHDLLHGNRGPGRSPLEWTTRLKLALGAAKGLAFLHGASNSKLSHQHLTSSNILVDNEGDARISDFGLLQLLLAPSSSSFNSASHIVASKSLNSNSSRGTTQKCDVYSFGVILLEILTGRPADQAGEISLARWVQTVVREEWTSEVFDTELLGYKETEDEMVALLQVALLCVAREPKDRPRMTMVYKMIQDIRDRGSRSRGSRSPSQNDHSNESSSSPCTSEDAPAFATR